MAKRKSLFRLVPVLAALLIGPWAVPAHASTNLLNVYVGASLGHASLRASDSSLIASYPDSLGSFDRNDFAYQIMAGVRGLYLLGAEIDYFNLGSGAVSPSWLGLGAVTDARISQKGEAAFAVLYLPVPVINLYLKAGVAHLTTQLSASGNTGVCPPDHLCPEIVCPTCATPFRGTLDSGEATFAAGAGVQWKFGAWAVRGEYERFDTLGEHPDLLTVGVTWTIL
ncbi:MAG: outer membrane beta-barrel protein [Steroidobacteraceae bacterium]